MLERQAVSRETMIFNWQARERPVYGTPGVRGLELILGGSVYAKHQAWSEVVRGEMNKRKPAS